MSHEQATIEAEIQRIQAKYPHLKQLSTNAQAQEAAITERTFTEARSYHTEKPQRKQIPTFADPKLLSTEELDRVLQTGDLP